MAKAQAVAQDDDSRLTGRAPLRHGPSTAIPKVAGSGLRNGWRCNHRGAA